MGNQGKMKKSDIGLLRQKAEEGDVEAQYRLGICYFNGEGVKQSYKEAVKLFEPLAKEGYMEAQFVLGDCYYFGYGVKRDFKEAAKLYLFAGSQGDCIAVKKLENIYGGFFTSLVVKKYIEKELELLKSKKDDLPCYVLFEPLVEKAEKVIARRQKILDLKVNLFQIFKKWGNNDNAEDLGGSCCDNLKTPLLSCCNKCRDGDSVSPHPLLRGKDTSSRGC
jgi:hypothetical protein